MLRLHLRHAFNVLPIAQRSRAAVPQGYPSGEYRRPIRHLSGKPGLAPPNLRPAPGGHKDELPAYRCSIGRADRAIHGDWLCYRWRERRPDRPFGCRRHQSRQLLERRQARAGDARRPRGRRDQRARPLPTRGDHARSAGLPMPRVYIMDNPQPNAFATGRDPEHAAVAVTTGLLQMLSREEVAGVIAHELAHVKNRDTLTMTITATIAGAIS